MRAQVLVSCKTNDPDVVDARRRAAQSKSVQELSQITSLADFPVPGAVQRMLSRSKGDLRSSKGTSRASSRK